VIYFERGGELLRCVENFTARMEFTGAGCYVLKIKDGR
jgi:hypothetical protein